MPCGSKLHTPPTINHLPAVQQESYKKYNNKKLFLIDTLWGIFQKNSGEWIIITYKSSKMTRQKKSNRTRKTREWIAKRNGNKYLLPFKVFELMNLRFQTGGALASFQKMCVCAIPLLQRHQPCRDTSSTTDISTFCAMLCP